MRYPFCPPPWSAEEEHALRTRLDASCAEARDAVMAHECQEHGADCHYCRAAKVHATSMIRAQRETVVEGAKRHRLAEIETHKALCRGIAWVIASGGTAAILTVWGVAVLLRPLLSGGWR